ncbi:hypothetical protein EVJ58_g3958 [Rhodofomes roseus]|uniref:Cytochrome P450 n=1 Tax=Rhodofomes roseus TaxID=34475 RepID=A0A4Y9YLD6_9APHY|nr:hypothetical protein EVJ58_g3958 [Rhodofomes roseus]
MSIFDEMSMPYVLLGVGLLTFLLYRQVIRRLTLRLPPGPRRLPIIGNALQIPSKSSWVTFAKWGEIYGGIVYLSVPGETMILLNSPEIVNELLEKRSAIYSDRPVQITTSELMGFGPFLPVCGYGSYHREGRRIMANGLSSRKAAEIRHLQQQKMNRFLGKLLHTPEDLWSHIRWFIASISFGVSHGYSVESLDDPLVRLAERANSEYCMAAEPGAFLVNIIPALRYVPEWFPGAGWKQKMKAWRQTTESLRDEPFEYVKEQLAKGVAKPSITASLIEENPNRTEEEDRLFRYMSSSIYSAGADTTVSAVEAFFLAMVLYPEVQRKVHNELDTILGPGHLADWEDLERLTYVQAVILEIYRWNPVAPIGLPHRVIQDDVYEGYHIPAGATILVNNWGILHNPALYPDPFEFKPERYLQSKDTGLNPDPRQFAFGYGRRVCPGRGLAEDSIFIAVASVLALFEISKALNADGTPIEPDPTFDGFIGHPQPFRARVTPRFPNVERMIPAL